MIYSNTMNKFILFSALIFSTLICTTTKVFSQEENSVLTIVEQMPEFPGGLDSLISFIRENVRYPETAKELKIQGTVFVQIIVEKDGSITNVKVLRGIGGGCDEEAVRLALSMPKWKAAKQNGKEVRCYYNLPIKFKLGI